MKLSELRTGEKGQIVKVSGHGGFRKRIVEMGFVKGQTVEVLLNAPLQDPVKYKVMGYEVSLRHDEADLIEVHGQRESAPSSDREITVALVGNPNCGKTSLFNFASGAHERVGNYSGVTVDAKEGTAELDGYRFKLIDLPGTYSLTAYSPEELYVRRQLIDKTPDVILNVLDASNIERNLYLTTQLVDMNLRMVCALNMYDEFEERGDQLDIPCLSRLFGAPIVPTVFRSGRGVDELLRTIISVYEDKDNISRHFHLNHGTVIEQGIDAVKAELKAHEDIRHRYSTRYLSIKLIEGDSKADEFARTMPNADRLLQLRDKAAADIEAETKEDAETAIMDAKYAFIHGALQEAEYKEGTKHNVYQLTHAIDGVLTNRYVGFPIFLFILYAMFQLTFSLGQYPMDWIEAGVAWIGEAVRAYMPAGMLKDMLADGIIAGVGAVIVFMPQILILYAFISYMEDSGYMARAAFIMDKLMHKMGLHGKSFIPLIMGFGCNVPAVMATRTIESRRSRLITMLIVPLMSCSARLPVYVMITGAFFAAAWRSTVLISLYVIGIIVAVGMSRLFSRFLVPGDDTPFVMELPPYRFPTAKAVGRHTWEKAKEYLKKMGGIILIGSVIVWALGYFPHDSSLTAQEQQEQSCLGAVGKAIEPVFKAQGFDWKMDVALIAGVSAKEITASTLGVLYGAESETEEIATGDKAAEVGAGNAAAEVGAGDKAAAPAATTAPATLREKMEANGITPLAAFCFLLFVLLYFPCVAALAAIRAESGSWRWALFAAAYTTVLAWAVSAAVYQIGNIII